MHEIVAALDNNNVDRVSTYIRERSYLREFQDEEQDGDTRNFQCLVISLKDAFFCKADALYGVYRNLEEDSSRCLTFDLSGYATG